MKKCNGESPCLLCSQKGLECFYCDIDRRSLKGKKISKTGDKPTSEMKESITHTNSLSNNDSHLPLPSGKLIILSISPSGLQPLLTLPLSDDDNTELQAGINGSRTDDSNIIENVPSSGEHTRLLLNSAGNLRYFGESSPLSLIQECRSIFKVVLGSSKFTDDPKRGRVMDEPSQPKKGIQVFLPKRELCDILVSLFERNINDAFYIFDMEHFRHNIVKLAYSESLHIDTPKLCLLYFVLSIGAFFAEASPNRIEEQNLRHGAFFDSAVDMMRDCVYDGRLWMVEADFLRHFYYQSNCQRSSAWIHLGTAIRHAQGLGLHRKIINEKFTNPSYVMHRRRLWRSLFICDRIYSIVLGRPLAINNYDWDDSELQELSDDANEKFRIRCQVELSKIAQINSKIVENIYRDGVINIKHTRALAIELKLWSLNIPNDLDISNTLKEDLMSPDSNNNYLLMQVHLAQLYGIMLLFRPFLMHVLLRKLKPGTYGELKDDWLLLYFCKACIKSSFLCVWLISFYTEQKGDRTELFAMSNGCLFASAILGLTLLEQRLQSKPDYDYIRVLSDTLQVASNLLHNDGAFNLSSERWGENVDNMVAAIPKYQHDQTSTNSGDASDSYRNDFEAFSKEIILMDNEFGGLKDLTSFQQGFIPSDDELLCAMGIDRQELGSNESPPLDAFMYDYGKKDQLFDRYI